MITATILANNVLRRSFEQSSLITPMKLQKLLYFIYRDYLKQTDDSLFSERFEVWRYGPVLPSVYHEFKQFGSEVITGYSKDSKGDSYSVTEPPGSILTAVVDDNWNRYKNVNGIYLSNITHRQDTPWRKAYQQGEPFLRDEDILNDNEQ